MGDPNSERDTFCVLPWVHRFADVDGKIYPCCYSIDSQSPNVDAKGKPYSVFNRGDFEAAWNSEYSKNLRRAMLSGDKSKICATCFADEDLGIFSARQIVNLKFQHLLDSVRAGAAADGSAPMDIRSADVRAGNSCNLKCRMCNPLSSSRLVDDWKALHPGFEMPTGKTLSLEESAEAYKDLLRDVPKLESLHFAGGEPLIIKRFFEFMQMMVESGRSHEITLTLNTNLTIIPKEIYDLWPHFKAVQVVVSLDGYRDLNRYVRYPSDWESIIANLKRLERDRELLKIEAIFVNVTVQALNVLKVVDLVEFLFSEFNHVNLPYLSSLRYPEALSVQILPAHLKDLAAQRLRDFADRTKPLWPKWQSPLCSAKDFGQNIAALIDFMYAADESQRIPEFLRQTRLLDQRRGQSLFEILPELKGLEAAPELVSL